jgi:hypothetical protein
MAFRIYSPATVNSCMLSNGNCPGNTTCTSTGHCTNDCTCPSGYVLDGITCQATNPCLTNNGGCDLTNGICTLIAPGTKTCACKTGFYSINSGVTCLAWSAPCDGSLTYETTSPSTSINRVCSPVAVCTLGTTYQSTAPTSASNRVCSSVSACNGITTYEFAPPTLTSNRVCNNVTVCDGSTNYETKSPSATSNRVCTATTVCPPTQYQSIAPTVSSDRICRGKISSIDNFVCVYVNIFYLFLP